MVVLSVYLVYVDSFWERQRALKSPVPDFAVPKIQLFRTAVLLATETAYFKTSLIFAETSIRFSIEC